MADDLPPPGANADHNPYAPPTAAIDQGPIDRIPAGDLAAAEAFRRAHIEHETSIKAIGTFHYPVAILGTIGFGSLVYVDRYVKPAFGPKTPDWMIGVGGVLSLIWCVLHMALGRGLTRLKTWARWTDVVLISDLMLLIVIQVGATAVRGEKRPLFVTCVVAVIPVYLLYLLLSSRSSTIFSPEYRAIIALTPHIKYPTSRGLSYALAFIVILIVCLMLIA